MHASPLGIGRHHYRQFRHFEAPAMQNDDDIGIGVVVREAILREIPENSPIHAPISGSRVRDGLPRYHSDDPSEQPDCRGFQ